MNMAPALLVFMSLALELFFLTPVSASVRFHTLKFSIVLMCLKLNEK